MSPFAAFRRASLVQATPRCDARRRGNPLRAIVVSHSFKETRKYHKYLIIIIFWLSTPRARRRGFTRAPWLRAGAARQPGRPARNAARAPGARGAGRQARAAPPNERVAQAPDAGSPRRATAEDAAQRDEAAPARTTRGSGASQAEERRAARRASIWLGARAAPTNGQGNGSATAWPRARIAPPRAHSRCCTGTTAGRRRPPAKAGRLGRSC